MSTIATDLAPPAHPLANGCVVESIAFAVEYRDRFPAEDAAVLVFESGGPHEGHAVCVFTAGNRIWAHDYELGNYEVGARDAVSGDLRRHVKDRNRELVSRHLGLAGRRKWPVVDEGAETKRALRRLPASTRPYPVLVRTGKRLRGVAFFYGNRAWVYLPRFGTTQSPVPPQANWAQAVTASVRTHWPDARLEIA